uniref:Myosin heavy chain, embryonic smooth muscle isoform-like n=1 Tax=Petromyzon marinus TaxID=7757 RepID=A0AAJ7WTT6_PETMA|nr:myosin heavy chain, embryonic smooth muscle isoform-like [Petromyzon marinus]
MEAEWRARCEEANIVVETREAELQLATMQVRELEEECRRLRSQAQEHRDAQPHLGSASAGDTGEEVESLRRRLGENQELQQQQEKLIATLREELEEAMMKRPHEIRHSLDELDGELSVVRAEMERVWDELRSRDAALEDQQLELTSTRAQLASCSAERQGLEQEVATLRRELTHKEETCGSRERALAAEKTQLTVKLTALEMKVSEREMLDESRARSGSTLTEKLESLERENREFRQRHNKARAQAEDLAAKVQDLSRLNLALQEERDHAQRELRQICSGFQDLRDSTEIQKLRVRELEGVARHLQKDDQLKTTQLTALVIELRELRKAYQTVSGAEPSGGDPSHADWVSRSRIIRNAIEAIEGQAGRVRVLEEELRAVRATPGFESLEAELQQLRKDAQANSNKVTALVIELKLLKEKNKKLMRDKIHLEQRLEDGGLSHDLSPDLSYDLSHGGRGKQAWGSTLAAEAGERPSQPTQLRPAAGHATTSPREERPSPLLASASPTVASASASSSPRTTLGSLGSVGSQGGRSGGTPQPIGRPRHSSLSPVRRAEKATRGHRAWPRRSPLSHEDSTEGSHREDLVAGRRSDVEEGEDDVGDDDEDEDAGEGAMYNTGEFGQLRSTPLPAGVPELPAFRSLSPLAGAPVSPPEACDQAGRTGAAVSQEQ